MARHKWIYNGKLKKHLVEINHSPETGKLMVKLNGEVMFYEYDVFEEDKNYFFIIDGVLCSLHAIKKKKRYKYEFIEEEITSGKKLRSKGQKQRQMFLWSMAGVFTILCITIFSLYSVFGNRSSSGALKQMSTTAVIISIDQYSNRSGKIGYVYFVRGNKYFGSLNGPDQNEQTGISIEGLPLQAGDEFELIYSLNDPESHEIFIDKPSLFQIEKYKNMIITKMISGYADLNISFEKKYGYCNCILDAAYSSYGIPGLSSFYYEAIALTSGENMYGDLYDKVTNNSYFFNEEINCRQNYLFNKNID